MSLRDRNKLGNSAPAINSRAIFSCPYGTGQSPENKFREIYRTFATVLCCQPEDGFSQLIMLAFTMIFYYDQNIRGTGKVSIQFLPMISGVSASVSQGEMCMMLK